MTRDAQAKAIRQYPLAGLFCFETDPELDYVDNSNRTIHRTKRNSVPETESVTSNHNVKSTILEVHHMIRIGVLVATIGLVCLLAFRLIGSSLDQDGFLQEPFGLLPIGYLLVVAGALVALIGFIRLRIEKRRPQSRGRVS